MLKVGEDLCETTIQFLGLLMKEKKEEKFQELVAEMKLENQKCVACQHYDSDSEVDEKE